MSSPTVEEAGDGDGSQQLAFDDIADFMLDTEPLEDPPSEELGAAAAEAANEEAAAEGAAEPEDDASDDGEDEEAAARQASGPAPQRSLMRRRRQPGRFLQVSSKHRRSPAPKAPRVARSSVSFI